MNTKLRVRIGSVEVECEGSEQFIKDELPTLLSTFLEFRTKSGLVEGSANHEGDTASGWISTAGESINPVVVQGTTSTLAARLKVASGPELIIAASARLTIVLGHRSFQRKQIVEEMRTASGYFKSTYAANLTKYLRNLVRAGTLIEASQGMYALSAAKREELERRLA